MSALIVIWVLCGIAGAVVAEKRGRSAPGVGAHLHPHGRVWATSAGRDSARAATPARLISMAPFASRFARPS